MWQIIHPLAAVTHAQVDCRVSDGIKKVTLKSVFASLDGQQVTDVILMEVSEVAECIREEPEEVSKMQVLLPLHWIISLVGCARPGNSQGWLCTLIIYNVHLQLCWEMTEGLGADFAIVLNRKLTYL